MRRGLAIFLEEEAQMVYIGCSGATAGFDFNRYNLPASFDNEIHLGSRCRAPIENIRPGRKRLAPGQQIAEDQGFQERSGEAGFFEIHRGFEAGQ